MLWLIKQEKWGLGVLFCFFPFEGGWGRGGGEHRIEQAGFCKGFLKKNNEQPKLENQPRTVGKKDFLGFSEYPLSRVIKNLSNNLKIILTLMLCHNVFSFPQGDGRKQTTV